MRNTRWLAELALAATIATTAGRAHADPPPDPQVERADQLFAEGKALLASNLIQACERFDESLRLNSAAIGTLLNVALCDEKLGRIASAVLKFTEARDRAKEQGLPEHLRAAEEHIAALQSSVPHLTIQLSQLLPDTKVLIDDHLAALDKLVDVPVDPGERVVVVSAPDRLPYRTRIVIGKAERKAIRVPALGRSVTVTSSWRLIGQITTGVGVAVFAGGVVVGWTAYRIRQEQIDEGRCIRPDPMIDKYSCDPTGQRETERAVSRGNFGTAVGAIGLGLAAAGVALWVLAPQSVHSEPGEPGKIAVVPSVTPDGVALTALGHF